MTLCSDWSSASLRLKVKAIGDSTKAVLGSGNHSVAVEDAAREMQKGFLHCYTNMMEHGHRYNEAYKKHYFFHLSMSFEISTLFLTQPLEPINDLVGDAKEKYGGKPSVVYCADGLNALADFYEGVAEGGKELYQGKALENVIKANESVKNRLRRFAENIVDDPFERAPKNFMNQTYNCNFGVWHLRYGFAYPMCLYFKPHEQQRGPYAYIYNLRNDPLFGFPYHLDFLPAEYMSPHDEGMEKKWPVATVKL